MPTPAQLLFVLPLLLSRPALLLLSQLDCLKEYSVFTASVALLPKALKFVSARCSLLNLPSQRSGAPSAN